VLTSYIILGLALGGLLAVSGVGIVIVYRTTGVVNLAYGAIAALSALLTWELIFEVGVNEWLAFACCIICSALLTLLYGAVIGPVLARRDPLVKAIGTLAYGLILLGVMSWRYGQEVHSLVLPTTTTTFKLFGTQVNLTQVLGLVFGLAVTGGAYLYLRFTRMGTAMRALADDREISATLGIPVRRVEATAWLGSGALCGITALLLANLYGLDYVGITFLVISFVAAALAGQFKSLGVTLVAALAIGVISSVLNKAGSIADYRTLTPFVVAIVALLWFGRHRVVAVSGGLRVESGRLIGSGRRRPLPVRVAVPAVLAILVLVLVPSILDTYWLEIATAVAIYSVVALSTGLLMGRVGLVSLCQIALVAVGGWVALRIGYATSLPFPIVILCGGLVTAIIGVLIGLPALRLNGLYFALITLMAAGAITVALTNLNFPNGGGGFSGFDSAHGAAGALRPPSIAGSPPGFFRYVVVACLLFFGLAAWQVSSRSGRAWLAIRQSEVAAIASGVNTTVYKLWAFAFSSFLAGSVGGLLAASSGGLTVYQFPTQQSLLLLASVLMGGIYSFWGAIVAGLLMQLLPALLSSWGINSEVLLILFGVGALQVLVTAPGGLSAQVPKDLARVGRLLRRRPDRSRVASLEGGRGE
jgi:ABC-type branched-subunit amino acid transport system permease subunit